MDNSTEKYTSLFDLTEELSDLPREFIWAPGAPPTSHCDKELLFKGELFTPKRRFPKSFKKRTYSLSRDYLVRHDTNDISAYLPINNPRLVRLETPQEFMTPSQRNVRIYGFCLTGYHGSYEFYCEDITEYNSWLNCLKQVAVLPNISWEYGFGTLIGKGNSARVHIGKRRSDGKRFAIKSIDKAILAKNARGLKSLSTEISIMRGLDHQYITKLYEVYENEIYIHMVMEYIPGGELFYLLRECQKFTEEEAMTAMKCLLEALLYLHERQVIHRDIKLENLILVYDFSLEGHFINRSKKDKKDLCLKVADFGLAIKTGPDGIGKQSCGSPGYVAPEVLNKGLYDFKADIFSAGVILYALYFLCNVGSK